MPAVAPRLTTTSFIARPLAIMAPSRIDAAFEQGALLRRGLAAQDAPSAGSMRSSGMSVMKPSRPWLMPISGMS